MEKVSSSIGYLKQPPGFATRAIHTAQEPEKWNSRAIVPPIVTSVIYKIKLPVSENEFSYGRASNPTRKVLQENLAALDNAKFALAFSSGVSAVRTCIAILSAGDEIIASENLYAGTFDPLDIAAKFGINVKFVNFSDLSKVEEALKPNTKMVWAESLVNPLMTVIDIKALSDLVHAKSNALVVVDNTYLPYFHRPLDLGADIALYSLTEYFCGHSDVVGGLICLNDEKLYKTLRITQSVTGTIMPPFDCYLVNRSVKTLALRMEKHFENSLIVAKWLEKHPKVKKVLHPSLPSHEGHKISLKQFYGHSGIFSFYLMDENYEVTKKFFDGLKLITFVTSLGGVETSISLPKENSHKNLSDEECDEMKVTNSLIRLSVGIEDVEDILKDLHQALENI